MAIPTVFSASDSSSVDERNTLGAGVQPVTPFGKASPTVGKALLASAHPWMVALGFLGIQFAWALQMGQVSPLLERLGSVPWLTSLIWAAGPVTGVLVQPIVGVLSDRHASTWGRRRPFLVLGTLLVACSLILMPNAAGIGTAVATWVSPVLGQLGMEASAIEAFPFGLLIAALLLWVLDASINITQGPYRALVPDVFDTFKQTQTFSLMSLTIGLGSIAAFLIGFALTNVSTLFYLGAAVMVLFMGLTILTTPEEPLTKMSKSDEAVQKPIWASIVQGCQLTPNQWWLCLAHSATWFGLMCLFIFFSVHVPKAVFGATDSASAVYQQGVQWASLGFAALNGICFLAAPWMNGWSRQFGPKAVHSIALLLMAISLIGLSLLQQPGWTLSFMALMGIGWATTLSLPFTMVARDVPKGQEGILMGVFNIFVAAPGVLCSVLVGPLISHFHAHEDMAFLLGAGAMLLAFTLLQRFQWSPPASVQTAS
ncbi:MAG: MFS transporter [Vampirovibrionales bacterium]|nr:MFS transporter [Vampirovibrionales bacterium]